MGLEWLLQAQNGPELCSHVQKIRLPRRYRPRLVSRYDNYGYFRVGLTNQAYRLEAIYSRHKNIDDQQIESLSLKRPQARQTIIDRLDGMVIAFEQDLDGAEDRSIIIDDENGSHISSVLRFIQPKVTYPLIEPRTRE